MSATKYELGVIGGGNMAEAILAGMKSGRVMPMKKIVVSEPLARRRRMLASKYGVSVTADNHVAAAAPRLLLAIKPQVMAEVLIEVAPTVKSKTLVVSIAAGINSKYIAFHLPRSVRIVRVMPNTPMLVGDGVAAVCSGPGAKPADINWVRKVLDTCGSSIVVREKMMDAVTAVSGSGPAYFFHLTEAMIEAGVAEGLPHQTAMELARLTCLGAARLMIETLEHPQELRRRVTSPGGTTQRALEVMEKSGAKAIMVRAIRSAAERSRELGQR